MSQDEPQDLGRALLPPGWARVRVDEAGAVDLGRQRSPENHNGPHMRPYLRVANVFEDRIDTSDIMWMNFDPREFEAFQLAAGDILLNEGQSKHLVGRSAIYRDECPGACFTNSLVRFRPTKATTVEFAQSVFRHYLRDGTFQQIAKITTNIAHLGKERFAALPFPLPPLNEQRRIVAKIEALQERSKSAKAALDAIPPLLEKFRQSVLAAAFRGDLTKSWRERQPEIEPATVLLDRIRAERRRRFTEANPKKKYIEPAPVDPSGLPELPEGWCWASLSELAGLEPHSMTDGPFGSKLKSAHYVESGVRVIRLGNLGVGEFKNENKSYITQAHYETLRKHEVFPDDLIIAALAEPVGRCCEVPQDLGAAIVKADCVRFVPHPGVSRRYVMHWMNSPAGTANCESLSHGIGRLRINMADLRTMPVALAPIDEQSELVRQVEEAVTWLASMAAAVRDSTARVPALDQSILAKAFRGELVPQDPNDEPASVLLERIRAEREAAGVGKAKRRRST
jgi:restriction endonuclease S subunit